MRLFDADEAAEAHQRNLAVVRALLDAGAEVNAKTDRGMTSLHFAAGRNENPKVVKLLLDAGAEVGAESTDGATPLHLAASSNSNPKIAQTLLDASADVNAKDKGGDTPLDYYSENEGPDWSQVLKDAGGKCNRSC